MVLFFKETYTVKEMCTALKISGSGYYRWLKNRGSQYASEAFREELTSMEPMQSLNGVNHCYDNARMETMAA